MAKITFQRLDKMKARIADSKAELEATVLAYAETCNDYQLAIAEAKVYELALNAAKAALNDAPDESVTSALTLASMGLAAAYDAAREASIAAINDKRHAAKLLNAAQNTYARHNASFFVGLMTLPGAIDEFLGASGADADGPADDESAPSEDWNDETLDAAADAHAFNNAEADADGYAEAVAYAAKVAAADAAAAETARIAAADKAAGAPVSAAVFQSHAAFLARLDEAAEAAEAAADAARILDEAAAALDENELNNQAAGWPPSADNN
jgi:hypothetical protein